MISLVPEPHAGESSNASPSMVSGLTNQGTSNVFMQPKQSNYMCMMHNKDHDSVIIDVKPGRESSTAQEVYEQ